MTVASQLLAWVLALTAIGVSGPGLLAVALPDHWRAGVRRGLIIFVGLCVGFSLWASVGLAAFFMHRMGRWELMAGDAILVVICGLTIIDWQKTKMSARGRPESPRGSAAPTPDERPDCRVRLGVRGSASHINQDASAKADPTNRIPAMNGW